LITEESDHVDQQLADGFVIFDDEDEGHEIS